MAYQQPDHGNHYLYPEMAKDRWFNYQHRQRRPEEYGRSLETDAIQGRPIEVTIAGHSFVKHLKAFAVTNYGFYNNLKLESHVANVRWVGIGGMTVDKLINQHLHTITENKPEIVYLELGTNDLASPQKSAKQV